MTVKITKPSINVREELADLRKPTGIAGEAMLRAETPQEQFNLISAGRRNIVINGAMRVAQRGTSFSGTSGGSESQFVADRFRYGHKTGTVTITQNGVSDLAGFQNSVKIQVTGTGTAATGDQDLFETKIEGQDLVSAGWGQSNAKDLTLSFYYKSNSTDNRVAWFYNPERSRDFAVIFASSAVNTWERITINIPADQTFDDNNAAGLYVRIVLSAGSQFTTGLASTWGAIGNNRYAGVANFHSSTSNYVEFTGVQLEVGKVATPFEHRSYSEELQLCQRYYSVVRGGVEAYPVWIYTIQNWSTTMPTPATMRAAPSITIIGTAVNASGGSTAVDKYAVYVDGGWRGLASIGTSTPSPDFFRISGVLNNATTSGFAGGLYFGTACSFQLSSEL
jgi:hypothetical protein